MNLTRHQLIGFGITANMAKTLTQDLQPVGKLSKANLYSCSDLQNAISKHLIKPLTRKGTRNTLQALQSKLQSLSPVIIVPFAARETPATDAVKRLLQTVSSPHTTPHKLKAAEIKGKHAHVQ